VDKPPLGFWIQAASAYLFGFHPWSLLLPQALAGILSVALLYHLVARSFGPVAGYLVAAIRSRIASPIILNTDEPVISLGGFNGADPVFSNERLAGLVREGAVRYFLIEGRDRKEKSVRWITENCEHVRQEMGQSSDSTVLLYDCSATELVESGNPSSKST
jgi:4-amino-4-deoxy-L-arabinose transferase-like glycosyltransferase